MGTEALTPPPLSLSSRWKLFPCSRPRRASLFPKGLTGWAPVGNGGAEGQPGSLPVAQTAVPGAGVARGRQARPLGKALNWWKGSGRRSAGPGLVLSEHICLPSRSQEAGLAASLRGGGEEGTEGGKGAGSWPFSPFLPSPPRAPPAEKATGDLRAHRAPQGGGGTEMAQARSLDLHPASAPR